jgi:beta-lactamase superfamily II metal-dependent hydrolase
VISIEVLPAAHGDSIWIEYGSADNVHRVLIDGGPAHTYEAGLRRRIANLPEDKRTFELMVVTHIDADHIDSSLILLQELTSLKIRINELWFNGWNQLPHGTQDSYAPLQGEFLGGLIAVDPALKPVWNRHFYNKAVFIPDSGPLPEVPLEGGAKLTLLSPTEAELKRLRARWASAIRDFSPGDVNEALRRLRERREYRAPSPPAVFAVRQYGDDRTVANGSSISFIFEHGDVSILLTGDAHARTLAASLKRLADQRSLKKIRFDVVKLPHHGSMGNVSDSWLERVDCERWLISTNGAVFKHPDKETAELIARHCPKTPMMVCNYRSTSTEKLVSPSGTPKWITAFPEGETVGPVGGLKLTLPASDSIKGRRATSGSGRVRKIQGQKGGRGSRTGGATR